MNNMDEVKKEYEVGKTLQPLYDQVILIPDEKVEPKSSGGILLQEHQAPSQVTGTVIAVGKGKLTPKGDFVPPIVKVGDRVRYRENLVDDFTYEDCSFVALQETEIICILPS